MIRLSSSGILSKSKKDVRLTKSAGLISRLFPKRLSAIEKLVAKVKPQSAMEGVLSKNLEHISVPELKSSLLKVEDIDAALKHENKLHELVSKSTGKTTKLPGIHDTHTRFVLYDPRHPFDIHNVTARDIEFLKQTNPEYLKKTLHVYTPQEISISPDKFEKVVAPKKFSLLGTGEFVIEGKRFNSPVAVIEGLKGHIPITPSNIKNIQEVAKKYGKNVKIVESAPIPLKAPGTFKTMFITGSRPLETTYHRMRYGGIPSVITSAWSLSPATKAYLEKLKAGRFSEITLGDHLTHGFMDIGLGRGLPLYFGGSALMSAMSPSITPEERKNRAKLAIFNAITPAMYPFSMPLWTLAAKPFETPSPQEAQPQQQQLEEVGTGGYADYNPENYGQYY